jgi:hypothetical protein
MRLNRWQLVGTLSLAFAVGGALVMSAGAEGPLKDGTLVLDQSNPLGAVSGTLPDGRTFGPMPMVISGVDTPAEAEAFEAAMPDLIPVLAADGMSIAGYADRRALQTQTADSPPVVVWGTDFSTPVGYWHRLGGFSTSLDAAPAPSGPVSSEARP